MGYAATLKSNIFPNVTQWGRLPLAFLGVLTKDENGQEQESRFINSEGKRLLNTQAFILSVIRTTTLSLGKCTMTYEGWTELLGRCDKTIWSSLKDLEDRGLIEKVGQSSYIYKLRDDIDEEQALAEEAALDDNYLPVAYFLFENWFMKRKKKVGKKQYVILDKIRHFSPTAVLILLLLMRHNNNPNKKHDYYIAGEDQLAATLNKPQSMINTALDELIKADFVHRNYIHVYYDAQGRVSHYGKPQAGKGVNRYCRSCYTLDKELRKVKFADTKEKKRTSALLKAKAVNNDNDELIKDLMHQLNCERKITDKDRRIVAQWFVWGFDSEMIKAAVQNAKGRARDAIRYVNGILKNWYSEGILTVDDLHKSQSRKKISQADIDNYYYNLRHEAERRSDELQKIANSDATYNKLNKEFIELMFASHKLRSEEERATAQQRLEEIDVAIQNHLTKLIGQPDLRPRYHCLLCDDTGYDKNSGSPCKCQAECIKKLSIKG